MSSRYAKILASVTVLSGPATGAWLFGARRLPLADSIIAGFLAMFAVVGMMLIYRLVVLIWSDH